MECEHMCKWSTIEPFDKSKAGFWDRDLCIDCLWKLSDKKKPIKIHKSKLPNILIAGELTYEELKKDPTLEPGHWHRIMECDTVKAYPIIIYQEEGNKEKYTVIDGAHRLIYRTLVKNNDYVSCAIFSWDELSKVNYYPNGVSYRI